MSGRIPYKEPTFKESSFNCPFCNAFANQIWRNVNYYASGGIKSLTETYICICTHCDHYSIWYEEKMVYPDFQGVESPNEDLEKEI